MVIGSKLSIWTTAGQWGWTCRTSIETIKEEAHSFRGGCWAGRMWAQSCWQLQHKECMPDKEAVQTVELRSEKNQHLDNTAWTPGLKPDVRRDFLVKYANNFHVCNKLVWLGFCHLGWRRSDWKREVGLEHFNAGISGFHWEINSQVCTHRHMQNN